MNSEEFINKRAELLIKCNSCNNCQVEFKYDCDYPPMANVVIYYDCKCPKDAEYCNCNGPEITRIIGAIPDYKNKCLYGNLENHFEILKSALETYYQERCEK